MDELLQTIGEFYLHQLRLKGHDQLFKTLGENLYEFLNNLDYVHGHMREQFPEVKAPSFRCEKTSTESKIVLHYYSVRRGYSHMIIGE